MKCKALTVNGLKLQCYLWGEPKNPPLFLIHGWLDTGAGFEFLAQHLQKRFYCIAPDLRGYGRSQHSGNPLGYFFYEYVADLHSLINKLYPRKKISLMGHSLGGAVASVYGGTYPERLKYFINVEGFGFQRTDRKAPSQRLKIWLEALEVKKFPVYKNLKSLEGRLQTSFPRVPHDRLAFLAKYLGKKTKGGYQVAADPKHKLLEPYPYPVENFFQLWGQIQSPALFVSAGETEMIRFYGKDRFQKEMRRRRRYFPQGCRTVTIPACGHMVHLEKPEALARALLKFTDPK